MTAFIDAVTRVNSSSGVSVTSESANGLAAVFAAISFISKQVSGYQLTAQSGSGTAPLTVSPDDVMTVHRFQNGADAKPIAQHGNAFARIHWGLTGWPERFEFIVTDRGA